MPQQRTLERARKAKHQGKRPTTQAGEFVREEAQRRGHASLRASARKAVATKGPASRKAAARKAVRTSGERPHTGPVVPSSRRIAAPAMSGDALLGTRVGPARDPGGATMPVVYHKDVPLEPFPGGATYQTLVGNAAGSTPVRLGLQTSPRGYSTGTHSHPYTEILTILDGEGEAWMEGEAAPIKLEPGMTLVLPPDVPHGFRVTSERPLRTLGVHASPQRIVHRPA